MHPQFLLYNVYMILLENWKCRFSNGHSALPQWHSERIKTDSEANWVKKELESH